MLMWIFFSSYCVNNRLQKGFICFMQLCLSAPDCCAPIGKRHAGHTRMANKILWAAKCSYAREVFTSSRLCQGSMGREQKSGESKARKGAEVLQKEAGRASARHGASEAQLSCPPPRGWTAAEVPQKASLSASPALAEHSSANKLQSWALVFLVWCFLFFLAVIPALPVSWKIPRKCCADSFKESDQSVNLLLFVIKRECLNLYRNYTVHWIMGSAAFHSEVDTGLQTFLHEHLDVLGWGSKSLPIPYSSSACLASLN